MPTELLTEEQLDSLPAPRWLITQILPAQSLAVLYGQPGAGKTFAALSMALAVANGAAWFGQPTAQGAVVYVAAEGAYGLKYRVRAFKRAHQMGQCEICYWPKAVSLLDQSSIQNFLEDVKKSFSTVALIIIDTLARCIVGGDENSSKDMGQAVASLQLLTATTSASVLVIHHTGKTGSSERGSSALRGAADTMISCSPTEPLGVSLTCDKMKEAEPFTPRLLELREYEVGDERKSLAAIASPFLLQGKSNTAEQNCRNALDVLQAQGETGATHATWREAFVAAGHGSQATFNRARSVLVESGRVKQTATGKGARYLIVGDESVSVPDGCQIGVTTPSDIGVISPPPLGGDTDTGNHHT